MNLLTIVTIATLAQTAPLIDDATAIATPFVASPTAATGTINLASFVPAVTHTPQAPPPQQIVLPILNKNIVAIDPERGTITLNLAFLKQLDQRLERLERLQWQAECPPLVLDPGQFGRYNMPAGNDNMHYIKNPDWLPFEAWQAKVLEK